MSKYLITGEQMLAQKPSFELIGRSEELKALSAILMRSRANSVLLNGPAGVGCTSLCLGLAAAKGDPTTPFDIVAKRLFWLDVDGLFADSTNTQAEFNQVIVQLSNTPDSILLIEDMGDFLEAARNAAASHFVNALFSAVKRGATQVIFETHDGDLDQTLKCHSDAGELLTLMELSEPTGHNLLEIVQSNVYSLVDYHQIDIGHETIEKAISLTTKYKNRIEGTRAQPDATISLLDRTLATFRQRAHANGQSEELKKQLTNLKEAEAYHASLQDQLSAEVKRFRESGEKAPASRSALQKLASAGGMESDLAVELRQKMQVCAHNIKVLRADADSMMARANQGLEVTPADVVAEFAAISGIPAEKLSENEREKLVRVETTLKKFIYGQDSVVKAVADGVKTAKVGRRNKDAPMGSWMFLGPSGTGKTQLAKALAFALFDDEKALFRFDMSEYMEKHAVAKLIGAPPGYEGFEAGGILTNGVRKNPYQILLFDEIEKAHPDVFNVFLQILSDGRLTDNVGRVVSFADTFIIMTTNIGQDHFLDSSITSEERKVQALAQLDQTYRSEFLNRFAGRRNIHCFDALGLDTIEKIVLRELASIVDAYRSDVDFTVDSVEKDVARDHYEPRTGARGIPGFLQSRLESRIVNAILDNATGNRLELLVGYDKETRDMTVTKL